MIDRAEICRTAAATLPESLRPLTEHHLFQLAERNPAAFAPTANKGRDQKPLKILAQVVASSDFITRALAALPELLVEIQAAGGVPQARETGEISLTVDRASRPGPDRETLARELRTIRQKEVARVGWRDLIGAAPLEEVVETLSELADSTIGAALQYAHREVAAHHGEPVGGDSGVPIRLTVLGLGKLGGRELNLSSDVDLVFVYPEPGETNGQRRISNQAFFTRVGQMLIGLLEEPMPEGIVFRTDMRLRPNGSSGPLTLSFDAMDHYYLTHGREWERYALIKARPVAGDLEGGKRLLDQLRPFVYRKYLDFGAIEAIRSMKELIERQLRRKNIGDNIKLGRGGIREIEFIVQSHQLIYGGRNRSLQTPSFWCALGELESLGILDSARCKVLHDTYDYLRRLEHRLQVLDDQQTHTMPNDPLALERIALALGLESKDMLSEQLHRVMDKVHGQFLDVFRQEGASVGTGPDVSLVDLWQNTLPVDDASEKLTELGFLEVERILKLLDDVRESRFYCAFSREGQERMDRLMPLALRACGASANPDISLARFISVVEAIGRRSAYLSLLAENSLALQQLIRLITASSWIGNWIGQHPVILDELLDPITGFQTQERAEITAELGGKLAEIDRTDLEAVMDLLREYRWGYSLRVGAADIAGLLDVNTISGALSALAEAVLEHGLALARNSLTLAPPKDSRWRFGVVAYGKLGSQELGYNSDLDIIFVYDEPPDTNATLAAEWRHYYARLVQRLVHILTTRTRVGNLYEIDLRLRPSGRSGTVVTALHAFEHYLHRTARTWEHQALVRARMISGNDHLIQRFEDIRARTLQQPRDPEELARAVIDMRRRTISTNCRSTAELFDLKLDKGGLVDIEFLIQFWVLRWAESHPVLIEPRDNRSIAKLLIELGCLNHDTGKRLLQILDHYLATENRLKLQEKAPLISQADLLGERNWIKALWQTHLQPYQGRTNPTTEHSG